MPDNNLNLVARNRAEVSGMMSTIPQVPVSQYDDMLASAVSPGKPDSYGPLKWLTDVSNRWSYNQTESKKKSDEGDLMLNIEPEIASIKNRLETIKEIGTLTNTLGQIDSVLSNTTDKIQQSELLMQRDSLSARINELEVKQIQYQKDRLSKAAEELEKAKLRIKDSNSLLFNPSSTEITNTDEYKRFNELYKEVNRLSQGDTKANVEYLKNRLNELSSLRDIKTEQVNEYNREMDKYNSKISRYFNAVEQSNDGAIDFTDINTYLYKLPGLHGSSSAQIWEQAATTAATALLMGGSKLASSGATKAAQLLGAGAKTAGVIGSTVGAVVKGGGALAAITGNLYTRDKESMMEIFTNYETSVKEKLDSKGLSLDPHIAKARTNKKYANLSDENIVSKILTGEIKTNDKNIDAVLEDSKLGLSQLYKDNMMLSISDIAQDYIMAMPWSKLLSKAAISTSTVSAPLKRKLSDFVAFGLEKTPQSLGKLTNRKIAGSFAKRTGVSAYLEGTEEGIQHIKGQDYIDGKHYGQEPSYFQAAINDISAAGKSTFGILGAAASYFGIPVKSELANDAEFIKNWKGGALLGGLMTGTITGASSIVEYNKAAAGNNIVMQLTADQLIAKDNMLKAKMYAERAVSGKQASVINALNALKDIMPEGMTEQDINEEITRANSVMNIANSDIMTNYASNLGIEPNDEDYGILIGLHLNATERSNNIKDNKRAAALDYTKTVTKPEIQQGFMEAYGDKSQDAIYASKLKTQLDTVNEMIDQVNDDLSNIDVLYDEYGVNINRENAKAYLSKLEKVKAYLEKEYDANKDVLGDGGVVAYAQSEADIKKAYAKHLLMELAEEDAMDDYLLLSGFAKDTDNKYKPISQLDEDAKSKALKRVLRDIEKYKGVMAEDAAISAETQLNEITNLANSIEDEAEVSPSEEAFVETAQEEEPLVDETSTIEATEENAAEPEITEQENGKSDSERAISKEERNKEKERIRNERLRNTIFFKESDINWERTLGDSGPSGNVTQIKLVQYRGKNDKGEYVGTIEVTTVDKEYNRANGLREDAGISTRYEAFFNIDPMTVAPGVIPLPTHTTKKSESAIKANTEVNLPTITKDGVRFNVDGNTVTINDTNSFNTISGFEMNMDSPMYNEAVNKIKAAFHDKGYDVQIEPNFETGQVDYKIKKLETTPTNKPTDETKDDDVDLWAEAGIAFRTQVEETVSALNPIKAKRYLLRTLGLKEDQVEILDTVITLAKSGVQLAGATKADSIVLWKGAEVGTEYHEAWHRVSLLLLPTETREKIYKAYRKRYNKNLSDKALEELLGEEFRLFTIANERSGITESNNFFNKVWNYIKVLATSRDRKLHKLFLDINYGKYSNVKVNQESLVKFREIYGEEGAPFRLPGGVNFDNIPFYNNYLNIVSALRALTFTANGITTADDLTSISFVKVKKALEQLVKSPKITDTQRKVLTEVLDKFESHFVQAIKDSLSQMFIRVIDETENDTRSQLDSGDLGNDIASHILDSIEVSRKDNIAGSVKIFFSTIPSVKFVNNEQVAVVDSNSGLPIFENGDIVLKTMFSDLHNIESVDDLYSRVAKLAKTSPMYAAIYNRLQSPNVRNNENLLTQIEISIKSHVHNYIDARVSKEIDDKGNTITSFIIDDAAGNNMIKRYPIMWGVTFVNNNLDYNTNTKSFELNEANLKDAVDEFSYMSTILVASMYDSSYITNNKYGDISTVEGLTNMKSKLLSALAKIGIVMDMVSLNDMLTDPMYADENPLQAFRHFVSYSNAELSNGIYRTTLVTIFKNTISGIIKNKGKFIKNINKGKSSKEIQGELYDLYKNERVINTMSKYYTKNNQTSEDLSVIGANGNLLYPISQNNFMSDFTNWLNNDSELVKKLESVSYIGGSNKRGSLILSSLKNGLKLKLNTFISFREEGTKDKGRDYFDISPVEDYLIKMAMVNKDHIILPTMADKKRYHTITGIPLTHDRIRLEASSLNPNAMVVKFSEETLTRFVDYMLAEIDAVEDGIKQSEELSTYEKVANYHIGQKNATYFRVFNGVYITKDGKETFVNFNDPSNSQKFNLQVAKDLFVGTKEAPVSFDTQLAYMNRLLNEMMKAELKKAKDLGIISMDDSIRSAKNNLLDPARFKATLQQYKESANDVIKNNAESLAVYDMIADFAINTVISIIEFEKVFSGDPAYYKWGRDKEGNITDPTIDKIKRLGGLLSTGENMRLEWPEGHPLYGKTTYTVSEINDNMVYSEQVAELRKLFTRGNFKDLLINKLKLSEQEAEKIAADPTSFKDKKYAKLYKEAEAIADSDVKEYDYDETKRSGTINEADATCFISPAMLRHIVEASDEWTPEIAEAYRILEETDDWRSNPDLYFKAMKASLKALKYMSFGFNFDERNSLAIPFFNKMAIFPLMKGLATGDNKVLYDRMNDTEKPVDMVIFNSAVKVGGRQRFSFYKDTHNKEINDLSDIPVYTQEYKYLRKQLVTDPHHHDDASLGTQVAKGVISNIVPEREYTDYNTGKTVTGKELIDNIFGSMNALSNKGKSRIIEKFGAVYDEASKAYDLSKKIFSKLIEGDAKSSNMNINVLDGIRIDEETGTFNIPLSALSDNQWLEERTLSLVTDETVDIHTPGGSFIQMSSFAFKASDGTIVSEHTYNKGNKLKLVNKDGSMDAIISIAMFADIIPNYDRLTFDEAKQYLIDNNVIGEKAKANSIGYRIPTQGLASISALRFVDVLPKNYGDMIVLPDAFTKLTGSDFDIDKLYVARYTYDAVKRDVKERFHVQATDKDIAKAFIGYNEWFNEVLGVDANKQPITRAAGYKKNKLDSYNDYLKATKSKVRYDAATDTYDYSWTIRDIVPTPFDDALGFEGNSDKANVNKLLSSYITILTQTNNQHELKKSIDTATDKVKGILKIIKKGKVSRTNPPFKFYAPAYQLEKKIEYTSSKKGIGPFALNNVHHALTQAFKVKFRASSNTELLQQYGMLDLDSIYDKGTMDKVLDWLSAMINAFVDIAKDPYIVELNIGNWTYNMTNLFLRTGMGETTFYFMPQPILKEIANSVDALSGMYGIDKTKSKTKLEREVINKILDDYKKKAADSVGLPINEYEDKYEVNTPLGIINKEELLNSIQTPENERNVAWYTYQLRVYSTFNNLKVYADALAEFVSISQVDTKKFGNSLITQSIFKRKYDEFMRSRSALFTDELKNLINESFIATKLNNSIKFGKELFSSLMFRNTSRFSNILSIVGRLTDNYYGLTVDQAKRISRAIEGKVKSEVFRDIMTPAKFRQLFFGTNTVAKRLMMLKADIMDGKYPELLSDTGKINNELINFIVAQPVIDQVNTDPEFITVNNNIYDKALTNNLIIFWEELLNSEHATIREFAEDLALYAFFTSADNSGANALFKYVPNSWRKSSGYAKAMAEIDEQFLNETYSFDADELFLNNWHNEEIVPTIQFTEDRGMTIIDNQEMRDIRELPHIKSSVKHPTYDKNYPILFINNRPFSTNAAYVKIKIDKSNNSDSVLLYKNVGSIYDENGSAQPVYQLVQKRGFKQGSNTLYEYGSNMTYIASNLVEVINDFSVDGMIRYIKSHTELYNKFNNDSFVAELFTFIPNTDINKTINDEINKNESSSDNIIVEKTQTESNAKQGFEIVSAKNRYNREEIREDSSTLYIFTDNTDRTSGTNANVGGWYAAKYGSGLSYGSVNNPTTAVIRGLDNAYPISTMKWFYRKHNVSVNDARWTDDDIEEFKKVIDDEISDIKDAIEREGYTKVVIPAGDGFFNSKIANISEVRTPKLYAYLKEKVAELNALANSSTSEDISTSNDKQGTIKVDHSIPMNFEDGTGGRKMRPEYSGKSTIELIKEGKRTATTRDRSKSYNQQDIKVGDIISFYATEGKSAGESVLVRVTKAPYSLSEVTASEWSNLEGWSEDRFEYLKNNGYEQFQYELLQTETPVSNTPSIEVIEEKEVVEQFNIEEATLHSGGAIGADSMWDVIGSAFGLKKKRHYYHNEKTPAGNIEISDEDYQEGREKSAQAAKAVWGYQYHYMKDDRLIRNWAQVKYSDAIFAVSTIVNPGENVFPNQPKDTRTALKQAVSGGTGYAVEMAIQAGKPVYIFNQRDNKWYTWEENSSEFVQIPTPKLTNNFAGIGTREISTEGKQAIHDVYANSVVTEPSKQISNETPINVYAGTNDNANLSNFANRFFKVIDTIFTSVEQAFQYYKALYANDSETASKILSTNSPATARSLGRSVKNLDIKSWDKVSSDILKNLMYESFAQNEDAKNELLSTGNKTITHQYNGVEQDNGRFSKLLMEVRDELSKVKKSTPESAPIKQESSLSYKDSGRSTLSGEPNPVVINGVTLDLSEIGIQFQLGEQQMEALNKIAKWLQNKRDKSNFTLVGYAGTGKTTIMKVLLHYLNVAKGKSGVNDYQLAAPTHKASGVLSKNVGERAMTLAKLLSIKPAVNEITGRVEFGQKGKHAVRPGSLVIVDEFSLINDGTVDILENTVRANRGKVLYLGDDAQLFPVGQNTISKALQQDNVYKLTDIKRQTGNNPLIRWLQYIRDNATVNGYRMKHSTNITSNNDGRMYIPGSKSQDWLNTAAKLFNSDAYKNDADFVKILAFTNKAVNLYNYLIRLSMGYESLNDVHVGETLTAYNTLTDQDGKEMGIYNSSDYRVTNSESVESTVSNMYFDLYALTKMDANIKPTKLTVRNTMESEEDAKEISFYILTNEDKKVMSDILRTAFLNTKKKVSSYYAMASNGEITRASASKESAMAWQAYYGAVESVFTMFDVTDETGKTVYKEKSMDFGYASTIHKSQGSTYTYAFVDDSDIATAEYNSVQMASQLRYVGMSRPKKAAIALTNYNIDGVAGVETSHMTLEYFENNIDRMNNESDDTAIKTCK